MATIRDRLYDHLIDSFMIYNKNQVVGLFLQGSQNYNLAVPTSDVDTKLIVVPSFKDIALARKPVSTTHIRNNEEHIDAKDIRSYITTFYKQNLNFLEILFTSYSWLNPMYSTEWYRLVRERELIAHMNPVRGIKSMYGIAFEKYHAMEHRFPSKIDLIDTYGYDAKQLCHLARIRIFMEHFLNDEPYADCLLPLDEEHDYVMSLKTTYMSLDKAREVANKELARVEELYLPYKGMEPWENPEARELLEDVSYNIMRIAVKGELDV